MAKILIVDDDKLIVSALSIRLRAENHQIVVAYDGPTAVEQAKSQSPDLIVMDINLPFWNGLKAVKQIHEATGIVRTPIIFLTASKVPALREQAMALGAIGFLEKPYDSSQLVTLVRQAIAPQIANTLLTGLSKDDQNGGTSAAAAGSVGWNRPVAAKTGTTQEYKSAAFVGTTPQLAGAVIAFDDSSAPKPICDGNPPYSCGYGNIYGGKVPARTFYRAMQAILAGQPPLPLPPVDPRYVGGSVQ
jgi:CheY-like chemotaxis protein